MIPEPGWPPPACRKVFAAAHVAAAPAPDGTGAPVIDWESTMRFREYLWAHGFGVAEAMDTSQRGMGLSWAQARELIARTAARGAEAGRLGRWPAGRGPTSSPTARTTGSARSSAPTPSRWRSSSRRGRR